MSDRGHQPRQTRDGSPVVLGFSSVTVMAVAEWHVRTEGQSVRQLRSLLLDIGARSVEYDDPVGETFRFDDRAATEMPDIEVRIIDDNLLYVCQHGGPDHDMWAGTLLRPLAEDHSVVILENLE